MKSETKNKNTENTWSRSRDGNDDSATSTHKNDIIWHEVILLELI